MYELLIIGAGQSGVACAIEAQKKGINYLLIDKHDELGGSWLDYPEKTRLFSPWFASVPYGDLDKKYNSSDYPTRDEMSSCLQKIGAREKISFKGGLKLSEKGIYYDKKKNIFSVTTSNEIFQTKRVILAIGPYSHPKDIKLKEEEGFAGIVKHAHFYGKPSDYPNVKKVVVVGSRNSAIQIAHDFYESGKETILSSRSRKIHWAKKSILGKQVHYFLHTLKIDYLIDLLQRIFTIQDKTVFDDGKYKSAFMNGKISHHSLPSQIKDNRITWEDGSITEDVNLIVKAVGYELKCVTYERYMDEETLKLFSENKIPMIACGMSRTARSSVRWAQRNAKHSISRILRYT